LPEVPKVNGSAGVQYNFELGSTWTAFVRADYVHVGDVRLKFPTPTEEDLFHSDVIIEDAFDTANLRLSLRRGPLGLDVYGNNVLDERGVVSTDQPSFGSHETIIRPREVGVEMRYSF